MGRKWKINLRHHGNGIGNELIGMGGNANVASRSVTSLIDSHARQCLSGPPGPTLTYCPHLCLHSTSGSTICSVRPSLSTTAIASAQCAQQVSLPSVEFQLMIRIRPRLRTFGASHPRQSADLQISCRSVSTSRHVHDRYTMVQ